MTTANVFNLQKLYKEYFGRENFLIGSNEAEPSEPEIFKIPKNPHPKGKIHFSKMYQPYNKIGSHGQNIWFPIKLVSKKENEAKKYEDVILEIEACTVSVKLETNVISTPIGSATPFFIDEKGNKIKNKNAMGCVHEVVSMEPNKFTVRGFLIGKNRTVPEDEIEKLKYFLETTERVEMHGGFVELFLYKNCLIKISNLDFPEVQGQSHWIRPFSFECEDNSIQDIEI